MDAADPATATANAGQDGRRAWAIALAACAATFVAFGALFSFGVFLTPLARSFDTTTGGIAPLLSGAVLFYYGAGAAGGLASDRYGIRPILAFGTVALTAGLVLTSRATQLWVAYVVYIPLVGAGVGCCYAPLIGTVGRWFTRQRSLATAVLLVGVGGGTLVAPLAGRRLVDAVGWRSTFVVFASVAFVVLSATTLIATDPPAGDGDAPRRRSSRELFRSRRLQRLYLSGVLIGPGFYAPFAFFNDYAVDVGIGSSAAAALVGIMGAASLVARLGFGLTGGRVGPFPLYRGGFALMTASLAIWLLAGGSYPLLVASAVVHGLGWAAWVMATPMVLATWFGTDRLGGVIGIFYTGLGLGALLGPSLSGLIIDRSGFRPAVAAVLVTSVAATVVALVSTSDGRLAFDHD